ncbi:MAG: CDP-diacylglycerol--glycerol-3-phosphate 3-phosphatidyltransferase [Phycisphaerales bacterium JB050]
MAPTPPPAGSVPFFGPPGARGKLPNVLTAARLLFAVAFFVLLAVFNGSAYAATRWALPTAMVLFIVAAVTDFLDGYLARKWNAVSVFGRVMDPFADKILVLGAFVMLAGPNFRLDESGAMLSGVAPWMVVVIIARELLITSLRGLCESRGINFSATQAGKLKMVVQSVSVPLILLLAWLATAQPTIDHNDPLLAGVFWVAIATTFVTAISAVPYLTKGFRGLAMQGGSA